MIDSAHNNSSKTSVADQRNKNKFENLVADLTRKTIDSAKGGKNHIDISQYKEITEFKGGLDIDKLNVIEAGGGVVYFEYAGKNYQISDVNIERDDVAGHLRVSGGPATKENGSDSTEKLNGNLTEQLAQPLSGGMSVPSGGTPLLEFLELMFATKDFPAQQIIKDSFNNSNQELLSRTEASKGQMREGVASVQTPAEGLAQVTLSDGRILIVSKQLTPQAYLDYTRPPGQAEYLTDPQARNDEGEPAYFGGSNGSEYKTVTQMPQDLNSDDLRVIAKNSEMGMIYFEYAGEKFKIQQGKARDFSDLDAKKEYVHEPSAPGENSGSQLYDYLDLVLESKGTPLEDILREAESTRSSTMLLRGDGGPVQNVANVQMDDGFLCLTLEDGKKLIVHSQLTPEAYDYYKGIGDQQKTDAFIKATVATEEAKGFVRAGEDIYLSDTKDVRDAVAFTGHDQNAEVISFVYKKPGGAEQKFYVTKESNPQLFEQVMSRLTDSRAAIPVASRESAGLPSIEEVSVDALPTTEKNADGSPVTVGNLAFESMVNDYRKGIADGSIGKDDLRAQFIRAFDAKGMSQNGMEIIPEHTADKRIGQPTHVTGRDVNEKIFDQKKIDSRLNELLSDKQIQDDIILYHDKAVEKAQGGEAKVKATEQKLIESSSSEAYVKYLDDLASSGNKDQAMLDYQATYTQIAAIDPAKAEEFKAELEANGLVLEMEKLMSEPGAISDENMGLAAQDITKSALAAGKAWGDGIPRRGYGIWKETMTELANNMSDENAPSWGAVLKEVGETWAKDGKIEDQQLDAIIKKHITPGMGMPSNENLFNTLKFMKDNGVLGSIGGTFSIASAAYQLYGGGGGLGASHKERLSVAAAFMGVLSGANHFFTLGVSSYDAWNKSGLMKEMGTDRPYQAVWTPGSKAQNFDDQYLRSIANENQQKSLDTLFSSDAEGSYKLSSDDIKAAHQASWDAIAKRGNVSDSRVKKIMGTYPRMIGGAGDVGGGVLGITLGAMNIQTGVKNGDELTIASGSVEVVGGVGGLAGGGATVAEIFGKGGRAAAWGGPIGFGIAAVTSFISAMMSVAQDQKMHKASVQNYDDLWQMKNDGLLAENGTENYVWLQTYLHGYLQRDAPIDQSVFDYRKDEFENGVLPFEEGDPVEHIDYTADGYNRFSESDAGNTQGYTLKMVDDEGDIQEFKTSYKNGWSPV
ncbi:hypothetical protein [Pseudomonas sp. LT1P18]|uniref:hypothetical protein n=1 Tax=Pseudomonas arabinosi TaxID=3398357 RepID=UPI0039EECA09